MNFEELRILSRNDEMEKYLTPLIKDYAFLLRFNSASDCMIEKRIFSMGYLLGKCSLKPALKISY